MKVTITHLKAPWPAGAGVGDVVQLAGDSVPEWAVGKCTPAADDADAAHSLANPQEAAAAEGGDKPAASGKRK